LLDVRWKNGWCCGFLGKNYLRLVFFVVPFAALAGLGDLDTDLPACSGFASGFAVVVSGAFAEPAAAFAVAAFGSTLGFTGASSASFLTRPRFGGGGGGGGGGE